MRTAASMGHLFRKVKFFKCKGHEIHNVRNSSVIKHVQKYKKNLVSISSLDDKKRLSR